MILDLKKDENALGLRIAFEVDDAWEGENVDYKHVLILIFKSQDDLHAMTLLLGDAYERYYDNSIDSEVMETYKNVAEYIIDVADNSGIEFAYLDTEDLLLKL